MPRIRALPEDFEVEEVPSFPATGSGEHLLLEIRKVGLDTMEVVRRVADVLGLRPGDIGYAGRKDRRAVTRQWLSVPAAAEERLERLAGADVELIDAVRHSQKLRLGDLAANRFRIVVREVTQDEGGACLERLEALRRRGMINRFGPQRFGRDGSNAQRGRDVLRGRLRGGSRRDRRFWVSALQAQLFNDVLERRPVAPWQTLEGDLMWLHGSGSTVPLAVLEAAATMLTRCEASPTGPLFGTKMRPPTGLVARLEEEVWAEQGLGSWRDLRPSKGLEIRGARRPLRVPVGRLEALPSVGRLELRFELPAGSYATSLLAELFDRELEEGPDPAPASR